MIHSGIIVALNSSDGGVPKLTRSIVCVERSGITGDRQRNLKYHGGPDRALSLFSAERIEALRAEGHPIAAGSTGENLTVSGLDWDLIVPGVRLRIGEALIEITAFVPPCRTISGSFIAGRTGRISQKAYPGWSRVYARVLEPGSVRVGDAVVSG